jgi:hypothetical protein
MHHTAIFTQEVKTGGLSSSQKGVEVMRCFAPPFAQSAISDVIGICRHNGGWVKIYRSRAAAAQLQVLPSTCV